MKLLKRLGPIYIILKKIKYFILSKKYKTASKNILQTASTTFMNRHPDIFEFLSDNFKDKNIKILSFGCSTGEECFSIREYLPKSKIIGVDINKESINKAKQHPRIDSKMTFLNVEPNKLNELGQFDVILALSVLCKNPEAETLKNIKSIYPFSQYEYFVKQLDSILKPGGLLIIRSSNFRFLDTKIASNYFCIYPKNSRKAHSFPKFDSENNRLYNYLETEEFFQKKK
jgi:2-polyprenyl-3-methyl-5-hydroxy-6-metoxy-1,4-benzoquinol methylase